DASFALAIHQATAPNRSNSNIVNAPHAPVPLLILAASQIYSRLMLLVCLTRTFGTSVKTRLRMTCFNLNQNRYFDCRSDSNSQRMPRSEPIVRKRPVRRQAHANY